MIRILWLAADGQQVVREDATTGDDLDAVTSARLVKALHEKRAMRCDEPGSVVYVVLPGN